MGIGYAAFNTELKISGTSKVTSNWDIEITNVTPGTPTGSAENTVAPKWDALTASMEADLYEKGDAMEYDVTIENKGTIDAKLNNILTNLENSNSEAVNITFSGYTKGEILKSGSIKIIHVKIEYNPNYEGEETSSEVEIDFDYGQNNDETSPPENTHLVKYDCTTNGGNDCSSNNEYLVTGTPVDLTKTGTKDNYDFAGWNTDKDSKEVLTELTVGDTDITLYAIFKAKDTTPPIIDNVSTSLTSNSITVVVAAHDDESGISKYEFSINDGEYIDNGNNNVYTFTGLTQGTNYNIKARVTNGSNIQIEQKMSDGIDITNSTTTSGDGLYRGEYEDGKYVYKGANPNNYIKFNNELWRILSKESDGTYKIIRNDILEYSHWSSDEKCSYTGPGVPAPNVYPGCNNWKEPVLLNTYLNEEYYNTFLVDTQNTMVSNNFNIGKISSSNDLQAIINEENNILWKGNIGLISVSEYIRANSNLSNCGTISANNTNIATCTNTNWLFNNNNYWTISAMDRAEDTTTVYYIKNDGKISEGLVAGGGIVIDGSSNYEYGVRPVTFLKSDIALSGTGTETNPFTLSDGIRTSTLEKPMFKETDTDNGKTVTITYPKGCGSNLTCTYQKDNGSIINVTSNTVDIEFAESGDLVADVSDGTNKVSDSYTVLLLPTVSFSETSDGIFGKHTLTMTFDDRCNNQFNCIYKIGNGNEVIVKHKTVIYEYYTTAKQTVTATISNGNDKTTNTYDISVFGPGSTPLMFSPNSFINETNSDLIIGKSYINWSNSNSYMLNSWNYEPAEMSEDWQEMLNSGDFPELDSYVDYQIYPFGIRIYDLSQIEVDSENKTSLELYWGNETLDNASEYYLIYFSIDQDSINILEPYEVDTSKKSIGFLVDVSTLKDNQYTTIMYLAYR